MPTLLEAALQTLSESTDPDELTGARDLVNRWDEIIADVDEDETQLMGDPAGFVTYAYAIMMNSLRTESNPGSKAALRRSRRSILDSL